MTSKFTLILVAFALIFSVFAANAGGVYRWVDASGKVYYGDQPPNNVQTSKVNTNRPGVALPSDKKQDEPASEPTNLENFVPDPKLVDTAACGAARERLVTYRDSPTLVETDSLGNKRTFTESERSLVIERASSEMRLACGGQG